MIAATRTPYPIPQSLEEVVGGYCWSAATNGLSKAEVFELRGDGPVLFAKIEQTGSLTELADEASRLAWLSTTPIPCPLIVADYRDEDRYWLIMTAITGVDLGTAPQRPAKQVINIVAAALKLLHALEPASCPFHIDADKRIALAHTRVAAGLVDEDNFDNGHTGFSAAELFDHLMVARPDYEDQVVTHGDVCLSNVIADRGTFTGFVDIGRLGVADRFQDLALAARDIEVDFGKEWVPYFFEQYGVKADQTRLCFYRLLDEFF